MRLLQISVSIFCLLITLPVVATQTGFLVAVPDRGFAGNETVRDAFVPLAASHDAELVFITDERSRIYVKQAVISLKERGVQDLLVLPFFISTANPRFELFKKILDEVIDEPLPVHFSRAFGDSYIAIEMLVQRLQNAQVSNDRHILLAGYGAEDQVSTKAMTSDLKRIAALAGSDAGIERIKPVVWPANKSKQHDIMEEAAWREVSDGDVPESELVIIPFHLGQRLDSMMSFDAYLKRKSPKQSHFIEPGSDEERFFSLWMQREANRYLVSSNEGKQAGVVFLAHGSDFHWNQRMREAVQELTEKYPVEFAFSMADAPSIRRAVKRLESRGVNAIVIIRVFGMPDSFRASIERLIGTDVEAGQLASDHDHKDGQNMKHAKAPRLLTGTIVTTAGGLGDHQFFARALLDRANELSLNPATETLILVAHGKGSEEDNQRWLDVLESLASQMKRMGGNIYRNIHYQTWQEDWKDKRELRIKSVRTMVENAQKDGGSAIVIAARTTGDGPAEEFLKGLEYRLASGFAPHALFNQWVEEQIEVGTDNIRKSVQYSQWKPVENRQNRLSHLE